MPYGVYQRQKHKAPPRTRTDLKGVICYPHLGKPWKAYGRHHGTFVTIGYFQTKEEAGRAYNAWALKVYGPDTFLNPFPS